MSKHGTIRRYTLIIEKINRGQHPSFKEIKEYLHDHGFEVSDRTIQRDIEQIRIEFGIELTHDKSVNGYWINLKESYNIDSFFRFLEIVNTAELLTESLTESKESLNYINFANNGSLQGVNNLTPLLNAIKNKRFIEFNHTSFDTGETKKHKIKPFLLKEFNGRWYVIGLFENNNEFRTFGIDRITDLVVLTETFKISSKQNPSELFEDIIGVIYSFNKIQKVVLSFTSKQGKYVKTLPIHKSQKILVDNDDELRIELNIIPNYELAHLILWHGENVKVIEPKELVDEIKNILKNTLKQY